MQEQDKKCTCNHIIDYSSLDKAMLEEVEKEAELLKQKALLGAEIEQLRNKKLAELIELDSKRELYGLDKLTKMVQPQQERKFFNFSKSKDKITVALLVVIMLILAIGVTPSGAWFTAIQTSYVELLVDFFRVSLLGFGAFLVYKLFKK